MKDANLVLRKSEIVELAGMVGSGRTEFAMAIFGGIPMSSGSVTVGGKTYDRMSSALSIRNGVGLLTENRKSEGLMMQMDIAANICAASLGEITSGLFLDARREGGSPAKR